MIAVCTPSDFGAMPTVTGTGVPNGRLTVVADVNVPSLPFQPIVNGRAPLGPVVRVNVTVRSPRSPVVQPSRSKMPTPSFAVASRCAIACFTGARLVIVIAVLSVSIAFNASHAPAMFTTPLPCLLAEMCETQRPEVMIAWRRRYGSNFTFDWRAALMRSATAPAVVGVAVEVPPAML